MSRIKDILTTIGWIFLMITAIVAIFAVFIGMKFLFAWIAEQLNIPYIWVI